MLTFAASKNPALRTTSVKCYIMTNKKQFRKYNLLSVRERVTPDYKAFWETLTPDNPKTLASWKRYLNCNFSWRRDVYGLNLVF